MSIVDLPTTRRGFLKTTAAVSGGAVIGGGLWSACGGDDSSGGAKPKTLNMLYATVEANSEAVKGVLSDYRDEFGIRLNMDTIPYDALQQKVFSELAAQSANYDVMIVDTPWMPAIVGKIEPLGDYIKDSKLNDTAKVDTEDFIPKVFYDTAVYDAKKSHVHFPDSEGPPEVDGIREQGFDVYGLPIQANALTMSYRTDLFDDEKEKAAFKSQNGKDLAVPTTWDDFVTVAKFFTRPSEKRWGTTMMAGVGDWSTDDFKTLLASYGGDGHLVTDDFKIAFNTPEGVEALQYYADLINTEKVTPPGTTSASWDTVTNTFGAGLTAMGFNYHNMALKPNVDGEVSYATVPKKVQEGPHFGTWMLSIPKSAKNKDWAYRTIAWLTSSDVQSKMLTKQLHPTRVSVYDRAASDDAVKEAFGNFYEVLGKSLEVGVGRARLTNYGDVSNAVAVAVNKAATGSQSPEEALTAAAGETEDALKQAGYL
ncbi:MAG: multiple sugar transport system substrate-binding protein [Thermoleophilaceae bacterium]|jgi:multiple sugar transport system substrate-binding protein|nr:multiple sugar transport system substrate-binding protein [Thermoleophilaceae bacterium]